MKSSGVACQVLSLCAAVAMLGGCGGSLSPNAAISGVSAARNVASGNATFYYTGAEQSFTVPKGVTSINVVARGARGGGTTGANGGRIFAVLPVTPQEKLTVFVGGEGSGASGGFNGGANGGPSGSACGSDCSGYGGGGASDIRDADGTLSDRILVVGGGGGEGGIYDGSHYGNGGRGGGKIGGSGAAAGPSSDGGGGGSGGTQDNGGSGGSRGEGSYGSSSGAPGNPGSFGSGGNGGAGAGASGSGYGGAGGGGGGGGYYGGGGGGGAGAGYYSGCCGGGGGGGSSYVESRATRVHFWQGWKNARSNGLVVFSW